MVKGLSEKVSASVLPVCRGETILKKKVFDPTGNVDVVVKEDEPHGEECVDAEGLVDLVLDLHRVGKHDVALHVSPVLHRELVHRNYLKEAQIIL